MVAALQDHGVDLPQTAFAALAHPNRIVQVTLRPARVGILDPVTGRKPFVLESFTGEHELRVEFLTVQSGVEFEGAYAACSMADLEGVSAAMVSLEVLVRIKQAGDRPKDRLDLEQLQ